MDYLTDTHCHLYLPDFSADLNLVIDEASGQRVRKILMPGIDVDSSRAAASLCGQNQSVLYAAAGIHPNSDHILHENISDLKSLIQEEAFYAIGEIGLDYYRQRNPKHDQIKVFREMLELAAEHNLPVCLHNREADDDMISILDQWIASLMNNSHRLVYKPGVFHAFNGSELVAEWALEHHFLLGISGVVTYKKAASLRRLVEKMDIDQILIETDAPYLTPHPFRGKRNEPKYVRIIAEEIAGIKGLSLSEVIKATSANADVLFHWDG